MTLRDMSGRTYRSAAEWITAVDRLAEDRFGPVAGRFRHQDHIGPVCVAASAHRIPTRRGAPAESDPSVVHHADRDDPSGPSA